MNIDEELKLAWAAGFIDGEGAVMITYQRPKVIQRRGREELKGGQVNIHLQAGQSDELPLRKLQMLFGGTVKEVNGAGKGYTKPHYVWRQFGSYAVETLRRLRPYLTVKAPHADVAIEFHERCFGVTGNLDVRLEYYERMRGLQHKGVHLRKDAE